MHRGHITRIRGIKEHSRERNISVCCCSSREQLIVRKLKLMEDNILGYVDPTIIIKTLMTFVLRRDP
jgi:hypothetical protein